MTELEESMTSPVAAKAVGADDDFAALLAESGALRALRLNIGDRVRARVIHIGKESVFCELSPTASCPCKWATRSMPL